MGLLDFAEVELERLENTIDDKESYKIQRVINKQCLDVLEVLCNQGHSGTSAPYIMGLVNKLWRGVPLTSLTGEKDEWVEHEFVLQNKRCSRVFRSKDSDSSYIIDAIYFCEPNDDAFFTCKESVREITFPCGIDKLDVEYRRLLFPSSIVPIKVANLLHLYRIIKKG